MKTPGVSRKEDESDLSQKLHDSNGGALAKDEGSTKQGHHPPNCEENSGDNNRGLTFWQICLLNFWQTQHAT